jgi:PAS domain S-box-containing protein
VNHLLLQQTIFVLPLNLSRMSGKEHMIAHFVNTINTSIDDLRIRFTEQNEKKDNLNHLEIATSLNSFGCIEIVQDANTKIEPVVRSLIRDAVSMLAVLLEKQQNDQLLADQKSLFKFVVSQRARQLEQSNRELKREISERTRIEHQLQESQKFIQQIIETTPNLIYIYNLVERKNEYANRELTDILGYSPEDVIELDSKLLDNLLHPDDIPAAVAHHEKLRSADSDNPVEITYRARHRNGSWRWLRSRELPFARSADDKVTKILGLAEDITESIKAEQTRKRYEQRLRQTQKMEAIGTLAGGFAHDFNNILAAILGYADLARLDLDEKSLSHQQIGEVIKAGHRARELVSQILAFTRQEHLGRIPVQLSKTLQETVALIRTSMPEAIEITTDIEQKTGNILADPTQIHQIVQNLCNNAAQSMNLQGRLDVKLRIRKFSDEELSAHPYSVPGNYLQLSISDTGAGIASEHLDRVFDPYFTTRDIGKGSGMGLAIVAGIMKSHDGFIEVESESGKGTTFNLYFPEAVSPEKTSDTAKSTGTPRGGEHILIVDDEESIVKMTKMRVERLGYTATATTSSKQALELFLADPDQFDLVITDLVMPEYTGDQLAREFLRVRAQLPVIICSGYNSHIGYNSDYIHGSCRFLMKPVPHEELARSIRDALDA